MCSVVLYLLLMLIMFMLIAQSQIIGDKLKRKNSKEAVLVQFFFCTSDSTAYKETTVRVCAGGGTEHRRR